MNMDGQNEENVKMRRRGPASPQCGQAVYGLGLIGALVWYWQQAHGARERVGGVLKALVWPAFLVYEGLKSLHGDR